MWSSLSNAIANFGLKKNSTEPSRATLLEISDDEICSDSSTDEGLECPICWESFNIVENVPYVLWCGHTLCHNCVLGLPWASLKFSSQQIQVPLFISCPWCHILTLRLVYKGNMKFPRKNFFLLWMVESLNGDRMRSPPSSICGDHQSICSPRSTSGLGNQSINSNHRRAQAHRVENVRSSNTDARNGLNQERPHISLHKSLDFFLQFTAKFPLVLVLLAIIIFVIPASAAVLGLYLLITVLFALPSFLVLYFAYPALDWLAREIAT